MKPGDAVLYFDAGRRVDPPRWATITALVDVAGEQPGDGLHDVLVDLELEIEGQLYPVEDVWVLADRDVIPPGSLFYALIP